MKSCLSLVVALAGTLLLHGELASWVQHIEAGSPLDAIFFRTVTLPGGPVPSRRPPRETIPELSKAIAAAPARKDLLALRAHEAELQMDFAAAEADWKAHGDSLALAEFYARRNNGKAEFTALLQANAFDRAKAVVEVHALGPDARSALYKAWIARHPERTGLLTEYANVLIADRRYAEAEALPGDTTFKVRTRAAIAEAQGSPDKARAIYDQSFQPLWPPELVADYFQLLTRTRSLRTFLASARAAATKSPDALEPAVRIFYYWQQAGNLPQAHRALLELRLRKTKWTPQELITVAKLFEQTHNYAEAARHYFEAQSEEQGLAGLIRVLLAAPEQPIRIGTGDLTYYRDIATIDSHPGFLNGILSLLFNSTTPEYEFSQQEVAAVPYFHRAKAAELLATFDKRFPSSPEREPLHASLIEAYAAYAENAAVLSKAQQFLAAFPKSAMRTRVFLATADAYARTNRVKEEFAVYDSVLKELGSAAQDYNRVLDRYLARLSSMKRIKEAIALYRTEIDRNPNDAALYDRFARFLDENRRAAEIEDVYRRATKQFADRSWHHKLARWYLRQKQQAQFAALTREITGIFSGTDLEAYFQQVVAAAGLDSALYRQLNLYAHQRFPHDLVFVRNLVDVYSRPETRDAAAAERLLRQNWYHDSELRSRFFELLSRTGRLENELMALGKLPALALADRVATEFIAEAQIWRCHYEAGAPSLQLAANNFIGNAALNDRAASLSRSLGQTDAAIRFASRIQRMQPANLDAIARIGDIHADSERFDQARPLWNTMPAVHPGAPDGYLEAATIFWDYFLYDDALRIIEQGRKQLGNARLFAYEAGAIRESQRDYKRAVVEYISGAIADPESAARRRLLRLASRPAHKAAVEAALAANPNAFALRVAVLEEQDRRADLAALLNATVATASLDTLQQIAAAAARNELNDVRLRVLDRQIALSPDPVEKLRLRIAAARLLEQQKDIAGAESRIAALFRENPTILGVVRAATDFYWRNKQGPKAVDTLEQSAARANADYKRKFTLEAARKATAIAQYARARKLLDPLLAAEPSSADLIAATADTYAQAGDTSGMRTFLVERLKLTTGDTQAQLRRTLIPVLTGTKEYTAALDQYIEIVNRYPEDQTLVQQASDYAREHRLEDRLVAYYVKATADSPRDARWPAVLARVQVRLDRYADAAASYSKALAIRPDRTDLLQARAQAEQRLLRFDDAGKTYARLYELAHRNPRWLVKSAEMRARLGDKEGAIRALRTAFLENVQPRAQEYFEIARTLEQWNWISEAKQFADDGLKLYVAATPAAFDQLSLHMRVSTRLRQHESAYAALSGRVPEGYTPDRLLHTAAEVVRSHFTPEEKQSFARWLEANTPAGEQRAGIAQSAGVIDVAVRALHQELTSNPQAAVEGAWRRLGDLQQRRMQYAELAAQLESYWKLDAMRRPELLESAARFQRVAGNFKEELRLLSLVPQSELAARRYADLLRAAAPQRLLEVAANAPSYVRNAAVEAALEGNDPELALKAVAARGQGLSPVWTNAYSALTAVHFNRPTTAFEVLLGPRTVGEQIATKPDTNQQLVGDDWFPYAARFGEHTKSDDYLVAEIEGRPYTHSSYFELGEWFREQKAFDAAIAEYRRALRLNPKYAEAFARIGDVLAAQGKTAEARTEWVRAVETWHSMQNGRLPETFWPGVITLIERLGRHKSIDDLLTLYVRRNGQHRIEQFLEPLLRSTPDAAVFVIELSRAAPSPPQFVASIADEQWLPAAARDTLYRHLLQTSPDRNHEVRWIGILADTGRYAEALSRIEAMPAEVHSTFRWTLKPLELRAAAATGALEKALADPELTDDEIQRALAATPNDALLEHLYVRQQNQLGLAELRLKAGNIAAAMELIEGLPHEMFGDAAILLERHKRTAEALRIWQTRLRAEPWDMAAQAAVARMTNDFAALQRLALDAQTTYTARVTAAGALRGVTGLGSRELDLLASGSAIAPKDAEQPYFFHARLKAADQASDAVAKVRLLRGALAIEPDASAVRPLLFRAAVAAGQPSVSIATWYPLLMDSPVGHWLQTPERFSGRARYIADQFLSASGLEPKDRGEIARDMAGSYRKLGQTQPALVLLQVARELGTPVDLAALQRQAALEEENRRRRPAIGEGIRQPHRVRPRVEGGAQ